MPGDQDPSMWSTVKGWFSRKAEHVTVDFLPDPHGEPLLAHDGYLRLWLAEGFLGQGVSWANEHFPVLHGGVVLNFDRDRATAFSTFTQQAKDVTKPGAYLDYKITPLVPFIGGTVEVQAALYKTSTGGPLSTAVALAGNLASLVGPPLSAAAGIVDKVSAGLGQILAASKDEPVLGIHRTMVSAGGVGGPLELRPGLLVVVDRPRERLAGKLVQGDDGRLAIVRDGAAPTAVTGVNYLVLRIECRSERDDWRFPEFDKLITAARVAALDGDLDKSRRHRTEALALAWSLPDIVEADRKRVADLVEKQIDAVMRQGIVPAGDDLSFADAAERYMLARDAPELDDLSLDKQLGRFPG